METLFSIFVASQILLACILPVGKPIIRINDSIVEFISDKQFAKETREIDKETLEYMVNISK